MGFIVFCGNLYINEKWIYVKFDTYERCDLILFIYIEPFYIMMHNSFTDLEGDLYAIGALRPIQQYITLNTPINGRTDF